MTNKLNSKEFKEFIKKMMLHELKSNSLNEFDEFDDEENLGIYSGDFDRDEFEGNAMQAAMNDIGNEFVPLGKSKFEKNIDPEEFKADLERQNLNLPNDNKELSNIKKVLKVRSNHEKKFGKGSLNENSSETQIIGIDKLKKIFNNSRVTKMFLGFGNNERQIININDIGFVLDKDIPGTSVQKLMPYNFLMDEWGPIWYITVNVQNNDEPIMVDFYFSEEEKQKYPEMETPEELARQDFEAIASEDELNGLDENIKIGDYENELAEKMFLQLSTETYVPDKNHDSLSNIVIKRMRADRLVEYDTELDHDENTGKVIRGSNVDFYWFNEKGMSEIKSAQDIIDRYFYIDGLDSAQKAERNHFNSMSEAGEHNSSIEKVVDAYGNPLSLKTRVEDLITNSVGHIIRFGVDNNGKQTVHVEWIQNFGGEVPSTITYPDKVASKKPKSQKEIDEASIRSLTNGRSQNLKPDNFPSSLKRDALEESLEQAINPSDNKIFLVINNDFNRSHYPDLIGKTFSNPPSYAKTKLLSPEEVENEKSITHSDEDDSVNENEFNKSELEYNGQQELEYLSEKSTEYVPENLQQFLVPNSFSMSDKQGNARYSYTLRIKKQPDETLKDIENFIREEEPGKQINIYTELEKGSGKWVIEVETTRV